MSGDNGGQGGNEGAGQGQGEGGGKQDDNKSDFKPITYNSQAEMDAAFASRAESARRAALKDLPEGKTLEEVLQAYNAHTEAENAKKDDLTKEREAREAAEKRAQAYEAKEARDKLAGEVAANVKVGDTPVPASLLAGTTKEELEASANALKTWVEGLPVRRAPGYNPFQGGNGQEQGPEGRESGDPIRNFFATGSF